MTLKEQSCLRLCGISYHIIEKRIIICFKINSFNPLAWAQTSDL